MAPPRRGPKRTRLAASEAPSTASQMSSSGRLAEWPSRRTSFCTSQMWRGSLMEIVKENPAREAAPVEHPEAEPASQGQPRLPSGQRVALRRELDAPLSHGDILTACAARGHSGSVKILCASCDAQGFSILHLETIAVLAD